MDPFKILSRGLKFDSRKFKSDVDKFANKRNVEQVPEEKIVRKRKKSKANQPTAEELCDKYEIFIDGVDVPRPIESFDELDLPPYLRDNLSQSNFLKPTPIQMQVIPLMLTNRELMGCAPTGSGKTIAFLLPIIKSLQEPKNDGFRAIILTPTRELAKQIHRECIWISNGSNLRIHLIKNVNLAAKKFSVNSSLKYDILITTPQRLQFMLEKDSSSINVQNLEWLVVDECDRLFSSSFRDQLASIFKACNQQSSNVKHALFSATYDQHLEKWCKLNLDNVISVFIGGRNKVSETIEQKLVYAGTETGKLFALKQMIASGCQTPALIFVNKVNKANFLQRELESLGINADTIHAERSQEYRDKIVRNFREGKILFLICTELMGRGVDFKAVNLVVNYDIPSSAFTYIHHIGRTGRAGRNGTAITFYTNNDESDLSSVLSVMRRSNCEIPGHLRGFNRKKAEQFKRLDKRKKKPAKV